jgi:hypothetical protein
MNQILHAVHIHAPPSRVYRAITAGADLAGWWTTQMAIDERTGGLIRFTFAGDFHPQMRQTKLEPDRRSNGSAWRVECIRFMDEGAPWHRASRERWQRGGPVTDRHKKRVSCNLRRWAA